ncbi:MAG: sulfurtransferase-like selenium metabolism protein YedF [Desulfomonilia bacterium]|jgi:selenium metabolism protein YedF
MAYTIDARGLACPQPVILTRKALETNDDLIVLVDDTAARENVKRLVINMGFIVEEEHQGGETRIRINKVSACTRAQGAITVQGPVVVVIASNTMGRGEDVLGGVLMKSFLHTLTEAGAMPDTMILFNTGVKLAVKGSEVLDDLESLANAGVNILACGTCLNYFSLKENLAVGVVSNMYDISQIMLTAGRIVQI